MSSWLTHLLISEYVVTAIRTKLSNDNSIYDEEAGELKQGPDKMISEHKSDLNAGELQERRSTCCHDSKHPERFILQVGNVLICWRISWSV